MQNKNKQTIKYKTIVIDPPWKQKKTGLRKVRPNQTREIPYKTMTIDQIMQFDIKKFADNDCHIFLWATNKSLREAFDVLDVWGFRFHCVLVWNKPTGVTPFSFQFVNEFVLFGYKGKFKINKMGIPTSFNAPVTKHSEKPDKLYKIAELCSDEPRIDIFARKQRKGWDVWGDEV